MNKSGISWTDYVFNAWIGCTKISPACKNCYAIPLNKRQGGNHWVEPPRAMADSNWDKLPRLNRLAIKEGKRLKVFCNMMSDIFDKNAPDGQRERFFQAIKEAPNLDIQLLTKRAVNIKKMLPDDWGNGYDNVCLGVTVENKKHGIPRIKYLKKVPAKIKFLSIEPLLEDLGELDLTGIDLVIVGGESGAKSKRRKIDRGLLKVY